MRDYVQAPVFPVCEECGHPKVSHSEGRCFCGCAGARKEAEREIFHLEPDAAAVAYPGSRDGWSNEEDSLLAERYRRGALISRLSDLHQRRPSAIINRLQRLG